MGSTGPRNGFDRLRVLRRVFRPVEAAQVRWFGRSALSVAFRTPVLVLHSTGRRSGRERSTPLAYHRDEDGSLLVVGGAGGQARVPDWVANLRADPRGAVTLDRRRSAVTAVELVGDEHAAAWPRLEQVWPQIASYARRAGRPVPVFRLVPTEEPSMPEPEVSVSVRIERPADDLYALVSDVTRMGEWSPENMGGRWIRGAAGPVVGARFRGSNRRGWRRWSTTCEVVAAEPGRRFAFDVSVGPIPAARWSYAFESDGDATVVTETWTDHRPAWFARLAGTVMGIDDLGEHNRRNMETTLANLARR